MKIKDLINELESTKKWYEQIGYVDKREFNKFEMCNKLRMIDEIIEILRQHEEMLEAVKNLTVVLDDMLDFTWVEPEQDDHASYLKIKDEFRKITTKETK